MNRFTKAAVLGLVLATAAPLAAEAQIRSDRREYRQDRRDDRQDYRQERREDRRDFTKHMIRLRHASQINGAEANEIILLNSHDGTSSYQMLAGQFRLC